MTVVTYGNRFEGLSYVCEPDPCGLKRAPGFHLERPHIDGEPWKRLLRVIDQTVADEREDFVPGRELPAELWSRITGLPGSISALSKVVRMRLYGSNLVSVPWQIGDMASLEVFEPYGSHRLHWYPYEITRCAALHESTVSTRVLYGNYQNRLPFPKLPAPTAPGSTPPVCSVCRGPFSASGPIQAWISLRVATDVLPLLVHACTRHCLHSLPTPPEGYIPRPHPGGPDYFQPPPAHGYVRPRRVFATPGSAHLAPHVRLRTIHRPGDLSTVRPRTRVPGSCGSVAVPLLECSLPSLVAAAVCHAADGMTMFGLVHANPKSPVVYRLHHWFRRGFR